MNEAEAQKNGWRCPDCNTPLEVARGGVYYCPSPTCVTNKKLLEAVNGNKKA